MTKRLEGKKAIVVGAGQLEGVTIGNGRAIAIAFAREGAEVLCVDHRLESAEETVSLIQAEGGAALAFQADVTVSAHCSALVARGQEKFGRVDILVNNVGIARGDTSPDAITDEAWDHIFDTNLKSTMMTIRSALPVMRQQKSGAILNISSLAAIAGHDKVAYEVSKMAVNRLTTVVALSNAPHNVRCNAIMPGLIDTPMAIRGIAARTGQTHDELRAQRHAQAPMRRMGTAWEIASASVFLCSEDASYVTGVVLPVDGGLGVRVG